MIERDLRILNGGPDEKESWQNFNGRTHIKYTGRDITWNRTGTNSVSLVL